MYGQHCPYRVIVVVLVLSLCTVDGKEFLSYVEKQVALPLPVLYTIQKDGQVEEL